MFKRPSMRFRPRRLQAPSEDREYKIHFGQIYLSKPLVTESDNDTATLFPKEARLRNMT